MQELLLHGVSASGLRAKTSFTIRGFPEKGDSAAKGLAKKSLRRFLLLHTLPWMKQKIFRTDEITSLANDGVLHQHEH
ncbi:MAG: hypothetical protein ACKVOQ_04665 [Cyclobacteriaceae bacterium]